MIEFLSGLTRLELPFFVQTSMLFTREAWADRVEISVEFLGRRILHRSQIVMNKLITREAWADRVKVSVEFLRRRILQRSYKW